MAVAVRLSLVTLCSLWYSVVLGKFSLSMKNDEKKDAGSSWLGETEEVPALTPDEVTKVLTKIVDIDRDGSINMNEMRDTSLHMKGFQAQRHAEEEYRFVDADRDGNVSAEELLFYYGLSSTDMAGNNRELNEDQKLSAKVLQIAHSAFVKDKKTVGVLELSKIFVPLLHPETLGAITAMEMQNRDTDGSGSLSLSEFQASETVQEDAEEQKMIEEQFKKTDMDRSGDISKEELKFLIAYDSELEDSLLDLMIKVDKDKNFALSREEITEGMEILKVHPLIHHWYTVSFDVPTRWLREEERSAEL